MHTGTRSANGLLEYNVKLKFSLIFREKVLDLRPKSVCADEMTMYVLHWTCVNLNKKMLMLA